MKKIICILLSVAMIAACAFSASAGEHFHEPPQRFSEEYIESEYYAKLMTALEESKDQSVMERVLAVALSQEGYLNYSTEGIDIEQARAEGKLWTGAELRMNDDLTGNTEYTRWAQNCIMGKGGYSLYADFDWCTIFVSWCMYQAGYYTEEELKKYYYSYYADPRVTYDADSWIESFNLDQHNVYYVPKAHHKLDAMDWNTYYNVDVDPYDLPYKPGGLVFFSWDASGDYYDHVAIVVDYDEDSHVLTYSSGNSAGMVITREIDLDVEEEFRGTPYAKNAERIMGYADYDEIKPLEQKEITAETPIVVWDKGSSSSLKLKTDSESVVASVYLDDDYFGSIIESNMIFHEGLLTIGRSELRWIEPGAHKLTLVFDDGSVDITLIISNIENDPKGKIGDSDLDGEVTILDATNIQRYLVGLADMDSIGQYLADTDVDGEVTILDATAIQRWLVSLPAPEVINIAV